MDPKRVDGVSSCGKFGSQRCLFGQSINIFQMCSTFLVEGGVSLITNMIIYKLIPHQPIVSFEEEYVIKRIYTKHSTALLQVLCFGSLDKSTQIALPNIYIYT